MAAAQRITMISDQNNSESHVMFMYHCLLHSMVYHCTVSLSIKGSVEIEDTHDHGHVFIKGTFTWDRICLTHVNTRRICINFVSVPDGP